MVLEKTLESPLDCKESQPVYPDVNQSLTFFGRTDAEAETPLLWPPDVTNWLVEKDPDAGKDWRLEEKGTTEDETVWWHHWLNGHEFELVMDREAWNVAVHGVAKNWTWLSGWTDWSDWHPGPMVHQNLLAWVGEWELKIKNKRGSLNLESLGSPGDSKYLVI